VTKAKTRGGGQVGFVVGINTGVIDGVTAEGLEKGAINNTVGGIAGVNDHGIIRNSRGSIGSLDRVSNPQRIGGVAGTNTGLIDASIGTVSILSEQSLTVIGGLVGSADIGSIITNSSGTTNAKTFYTIGGLVGENSGSIETSYASGSIESDNRDDPIAGGLVGGNAGSITDCYSMTNVAAYGEEHTNLAGGLVGANYKGGTITTSYEIGTVNIPFQPGGGVVGWNDNNVAMSSAYWDTDTSHATTGCLSGNCTGVHPISDMQLKSGLPDGFDRATWDHKKSINNGSPYLIANPPH
jgi:hypothetical protein